MYRSFPPLPPPLHHQCCCPPLHPLLLPPPHLCSISEQNKRIKTWNALHRKQRKNFSTLKSQRLKQSPRDRTVCWVQVIREKEIRKLGQTRKWQTIQNPIKIRRTGKKLVRKIRIKCFLPWFLTKEQIICWQAALSSSRLQQEATWEDERWGNKQKRRRCDWKKKRSSTHQLQTESVPDNNKSQDIKEGVKRRRRRRRSVEKGEN